jgi:hypothetical protein
LEMLLIGGADRHAGNSRCGMKSPNAPVPLEAYLFAS